MTWEGGRIEPGQFEEFQVQVGPLPDAAGSTLAFPAVQTYDTVTSCAGSTRWCRGRPSPSTPPRRSR